MQRLYELGARRVIVTGTGMIGCVPAELALHSLDGSCAVDLTRAGELFNPQLERMLTELNGEVGHDNVFIAANTNKISFDFMFNPQQYGINSYMLFILLWGLDDGWIEELLIYLDDDDELQGS